MTTGIGSVLRCVEIQILACVFLLIPVALILPDILCAQGDTIRIGALEFRCDGCVDVGDGLCRVMLSDSSAGKSTGGQADKLGLYEQSFVVCSELLDEALELEVADLKRQVAEGGSRGETGLSAARGGDVVSNIRPSSYKVSNFNLLTSSALRYICSSDSGRSTPEQGSGSLGGSGLDDGRLKARLLEYLLLSNVNDGSLAGHLASLSEHELGNIVAVLETDTKIMLSEQVVAQLWTGLLRQRNKKLVPLAAYCLHLMPSISIGQILNDSSSLFVQSQSDQLYRYALSGWLSSLGEALSEVERVNRPDVLSYGQSQDPVPYAVHDPSKLSLQMLALSRFLRECSIETSIELRAKACQLSQDMLSDANVARLAQVAIAEAEIATQGVGDPLSPERERAKQIIAQSLLGLLACLYLFRVYGRFRQNDDKLSGYDVADKISIAETERLRALLRKFDLPVRTTERVLSEAFRNSAKLSHPDLHPDKQDEFRELNEAYEEARLLLRKFNNTIKKT